MLGKLDSTEYTRVFKQHQTFFFGFESTQLARQITSRTHKDGGAVIKKPGSAWLEGTPAMDLGHIEKKY